MPKNKDFAIRIEIIDECLRNRLKRWSLQTLIDAVNDKLTEHYGKSVGKRTIQGDLKYLKDEKQAPIQKIKKGSETYLSYSDPDYSIKNLSIKNEEIIFLNDAINILRQVSDFKMLDDLDEIIGKLQNTVTINADGCAPIIHFEKHTISIGTHYIDDLFTAIKCKVPLRISYQSFKSTTPKSFIFYPYLLKEYRNRWFLIGRKGNETMITNLALDRIKEIKNSSECFIENDLFNCDTYFSNLIGVTFPEGQGIEAIILKVSANQVPYIRTKPIHHTQTVIREYRNGDIAIQLKLICNYELQSVLLGYGADIEVRRPLELRNCIKEILSEAVSQYE